MDIDWKVVSQREGDCWLTPYVPMRGRPPYLGNEEVTDQLAQLVDRSSGVTVATGFDVGTKSKHELDVIGLPAAIQKKLGRFCKLHRRQAMEELYRAIREGSDPYAIDLTEPEADLVDALSQQYMTATIAREYDKGVAGQQAKKRFAELDSRVQTAIVCFAWQYGQHLTAYHSEPGRTFKKLIFEQHWLDVANHLKSIQNDRLRRALEASLFYDFCQWDSFQTTPTSVDGSALQHIRRHEQAAQQLKKPGQVW